MANANLWAKNYRFADVEHGTGKVIADEGNGYQWEEKDDKMTSCAIYFRFPETEEATETSYNGQNMGSVLQGLLGYLLPERYNIGTGWKYHCQLFGRCF